MDNRFYTLIRDTNELTMAVVDVIQFAERHKGTMDYLDLRYNDIRGAINDFQDVIKHIAEDEFKFFIDSMQP